MVSVVETDSLVLLLLTTLHMYDKRVAPELPSSSSNVLLRMSEHTHSLLCGATFAESAWFVHGYRLICKVSGSLESCERYGTAHCTERGRRTRTTRTLSTSNYRLQTERLRQPVSRNEVAGKLVV